MSRVLYLAAFIGVLMLSAHPGRAQGLSLSLSVKSSTVVAPNAVQAALLFQNNSRRTIWLYRPIKNASMAQSRNRFEAAAANATGPNTTSGGSALQVHLAPVKPPPGGAGVAAHGSVILTPAFPHPGLVRLQPGRQYGVRVGIIWKPAQANTGKERQPLWGRYQFSVTYSARYSNQDEVVRELGVNLWHQQVKSNSVTLDLEPPSGRGRVEGTVFGSGGESLAGILSTLSDSEENPINQVRTDLQGKFIFPHLAWGNYWLTVRQIGASQDTTVYRRFKLSSGSPQANTKLMMLPDKSNDTHRLLHKPVLFRAVDSNGKPLAGIKLVVVWSTGTSVADFKTETAKDGAATINLIPGQNFVTLSGHKCTSIDRRADVQPGSGVNGFQYTMNCWR